MRDVVRRLGDKWAICFTRDTSFLCPFCGDLVSRGDQHSHEMDTKEDAESWLGA